MNSFDYRQVIKSEFARRRSANAAYSLRAFARDTGLTAPHLSAILSGRRGLSKEKAESIAEALGLSQAESERFLLDVLARHGRSQTDKSLGQNELKKLTRNQGKDYWVIEDAQFRVISDWYHVAILHLAETRDFEWNAKYISIRLGISVAEASSAVQALATVGLIKKVKNTYVVQKDFLSTKDIPSKAIRHNHFQMMAKAKQALEKQNILDRDFSSVTVAIEPDRLPELKKFLHDFREKFCNEANRGRNRSEVFNLSMQFFKLTQTQSKGDSI